MDKRIRVGVIFGGKSGEHEVSIQSGKSILKSLDDTKYKAIPIGISRTGHWLIGDKAFQQLEAEAQIVIGSPSPSEGEALHDNADLSALRANEQSAVVPNELVEDFDIVIPVLHGPNGEDGTIQGMLELLDVPYVGAGVLASSVGMDKVFMKKLFAAAGLPQVPYTFYTRKQWQEAPGDVIGDIEDKLGYPCFVKPANMGSSVGISKVKSRDDLPAALNLAAKYDRKLVVEQGADVREVEVAVLGNDNPMASVPGEIIPSNEFYDYNAKYVSGDSTLIIPAPVPEDVTKEIQRWAVAAFQAVDCTGLARVDFFVERGTNRVLVNEINTMPGFTQFSMYPKLWEATGVSYAELIEKLIQLGIERHQEKQQTTNNFSAE